VVIAASALNTLIFVLQIIGLVGWVKLGVMVFFPLLFSFTEWEITEWSEQQAVFSFLYDSIELIIVFGPPIGKSQNGYISVLWIGNIK